MDNGAVNEMRVFDIIGQLRKWVGWGNRVIVITKQSVLQGGWHNRGIWRSGVFGKVARGRVFWAEGCGFFA